MALFGKKKEEKVEAPLQVTPAVTGSGMPQSLAHVLKHARITEKATMHSAESVYTFDIGERATKRDVIQAVRAVYKVTPRMVRIVPVPTKPSR